MECQRIMINLLLIIYRKLIAIAKKFPLLYSLLNFFPPIYINIDTQLMVYINMR